MDKTKMAASRFRLDFPKLKEPVEVTSHGKVIGHYVPRTERDIPMVLGRVREEELNHG